MLMIFTRQEPTKFVLRRDLDWLSPGRGTKGVGAGWEGTFFTAHFVVPFKF